MENKIIIQKSKLEDAVFSDNIFEYIYKFKYNVAHAPVNEININYCLDLYNILRNKAKYTKNNAKYETLRITCQNIAALEGYELQIK